MVPSNPTGFYRHLWQAQDHIGCPRRTFPACAMDAVGVKARGDHWDAHEWGQMLEFMSNGNPAPAFEYGIAANLSIRDFTIAVTTQQAAVLASGYHYWGTFFADDTATLVCFFFHDGAGLNDVYDSRTMAHYTNLPGAFPAKWRSTGRYAIMANGDAFGDPWRNPI